jgi:hypothetical protein
LFYFGSFFSVFFFSFTRCVVKLEQKKKAKSRFFCVLRKKGEHRPFGRISDLPKRGEEREL